MRSGGHVGGRDVEAEDLAGPPDEMLELPEHGSVGDRPELDVDPPFQGQGAERAPPQATAQAPTLIGSQTLHP